MAGAPGNIAFRHRAIDQRKRRLQRIHVADRLAALHQIHVEIRNAPSANFSLAHQLRHRAPGILNAHAAVVGPVELVKVDTFDAEPAEGSFALFADGFRLEHALRLAHAIFGIPYKPAFCEDQRTLGRRKLAQQFADKLLGMAQAVNRRSVDPVDAELERMAHGGE